MKIIELILGQLRWPLVVCFMGCFGLWLLRKHLGGLIDRFKVRFNKGMLEAATFQGDAKPVERGLDSEALKRLEAVRNVAVLPIMQEQIGLIRADLHKIGVGQEEQVELLVKHLAATQLLLRAEMTYRTIFGSQIALLKFLNTTGGHTRADLLRYYEVIKAQFPELYGTYSFEQYLHYLVSQGLIIAQGPDEYNITIAGQEFLKWMTSASVTENKPY